MASRRLEKKDSSLMFREISPPRGWKEDPLNHYLRLTLPGFEARDITIHMDKYGHLVVRGNKQVTEHKYISFEETVDVPKDADLEEAEGLFEDNQIYCVTIPKKRVGLQFPWPKIRSPMRYSAQLLTLTGGKSQLVLPNNPLQVIKGNKFNKRIGFFIALLAALLIVAVVLIVKLRHH